MNKKVLFIYGFGSNANDSNTMKVCKEVMDELGYDLVSIDYDQMNPQKGLATLEKYIRDNDIQYVMGHSLGGFMTMCINIPVKKIVINPCMQPHIELPKLDKLPTHTIDDYELLEGWLLSDGILSLFEDVLGFFGDHDELVDFYDMFKSRYIEAYRFNSSHRPTISSFTEDVKRKIRHYFC